MDELVIAAKEDGEAFAALYRRHVQAVYSYFLTRTGSRELAEDLTSETWEIVVKKIRGLRSEEMLGFLAWLFQIAGNVLKKNWRGKKETVEYEEFLMKEVDGNSPEREAEQNELKAIWQEVAALPEMQRETVMLRFGSDLRNKEIAEILEVAEKTVASNLSRAMATLRGGEFLQYLAE